MDSLITAAAHALAAGDPLGALKRIALRDDAPALALRGIAMAQLGDLARAKVLLRRAVRGFDPKEVVARARCVVAEAEIAFVSRDLGWPAKALEKARLVLEAARRPGQRRARAISRSAAPPVDRAPRRGRASARRPRSHALPTGVENRPRAGGRGDRDSAPPDEGGARRARSGRARRAPTQGSLRLTAEVERACLVLNTPAARLMANGEERLLLLEEVEALLAANAVVVDACRHAVRDGRHGDFPRHASRVVCDRPGAGGGVAGRRREGHADGARIRLEVR